MNIFQDQAVLLEALRRGEEKAFVYLFNRYYERLFGYASRIVKETELAHDLVQESFCKLFENHEKLDIHISIQAYLYKSVYNSCLNAIKHRQIIFNYMDRGLTDFYLTEVVQPPEAEITLHREDIKIALWKEVNKLPERCREVFVLSKVEELTNKEIADKLDISVKTVEVQMTKALSRLRKKLEWLLFIFLTF